MAGRLQKVAAIIAAMSACAAWATNDGPDGSWRLLPGERAAILPAPALSVAGANDESRWSFSASTQHEPWQPGERLGGTRLAARDALEGDATRASLALDWQRRLGTGYLGASAFTARRQLGVTSVEELATEHLEQRDLRGTSGLEARYAAGGFQAALRLREQALDADARLRGMSSRPLATLRQDRLRQANASLDVRQRFFPAPGAIATVGARVEEYRFDVRSDLAGRTGSAGGVLASPSVALEIGTPAGTRLFARLARGDGDEGTASVATDPRTRSPLGVLDPAADALAFTLGLASRWTPSLETRIAASRTHTRRELLLSGDEAVSVIERPARRDALQASARWHALPWLTVDAEATWLTAAFTDGARERVAGAASRYATAGATVRPVRGWSASLFVSHFAAGGGIEDEGERLRSSTLVNGRLTRNLSRSTRVSVDVFNIFDQRIPAIDYHAASRLWGQPGMADDFLFHPAEPRGFRLRLRTTF